MKIVFAILTTIVLFSPSGYAATNNSNGKQLFEVRCGGLCHQLPEPDMLKAKQWRKVILTMQKRMQQSGMPALNQTEFNDLLQYLSNVGG